MCGIAGIISNQNNHEERMSSMLKAQHHRGPDFSDFDTFSGCTLGHNRLSIIDINPRSNQPFVDNTERYTLVFNGEIYNYLELREELTYDFQTNSDTEVLLAAYLQWGKNCLDKFIGMFSFAIWDRQEQELFAARDRFGVKPFYYHHDNSEFIFASEIKAVFASGISRQMNKKVWANYFCFGSYGMPNETFWDSIFALPGGHYLELKNHQLTIHKWYHFEKEVSKQPKISSYEEAMHIYEELLKNSIKLRFRSDVQVGFNISGGLDSSALLTYVNQYEPSDKINAYTFYTDDERYDELPWVNQMISLTNNPLNKVLLKANQIKSLSKKINWHQDEPFGGIPTLAYSEIFKAARNNDTIVLLDGQGMDEQWAGYDYYFQDQNTNIVQGVKKSPFRKNVLSKELLKYADKPQYPRPFREELLNKQYRDLFFTKIPRALRFNDRISMAYSTELREPFLDHRMVEFAFSLPVEYKIKDQVQKKMLRDLVKDSLGTSLSYAPKRPLQTPQREWFANDLKTLVEESIDKIESSEFAEWFHCDKLRGEWSKYLAGDQDSSFHIWQWFNFQLLIS